MSQAQNKQQARKFVEEVFNERKTEAAKNYVTPDIVYHGVGEEVRTLDGLKRWVSEDLNAFPDMKITVLDEFGEENKVALRWQLKATHERDFAGLPATHRKFAAEGVDIFQFDGDKIKEAWTVSDLSVLF